MPVVIGDDASQFLLDTNLTNNNAAAGSNFTITAISSQAWLVDGYVNVGSTATEVGSAIFSNI